MILIELTAAIDAAGTLKTFYVSTDGFVTSPIDVPANTSFLPCVVDPGSIGLHAFSDGRTGGATKLETGEIVLANDGRLDAWKNYSFDGRPVVIRSGEAGSYPSGFATLMVGTAEGVDAGWDKVIIRLRDKQYLFDLPVLTALYGGTNALPAGLDGLATDLKGKARPRAWGSVFNVSPPQVNTSRLIFEVGACNSVDAVYSNGAALTVGAVYTSQADMEANAPAAGAFRAWPAGGYFRIGNYSAEQITADVTQGATTADRTAAQVLKSLALAAGVNLVEVAAGDITALDALNAAAVGIWIDDASTTFSSSMDEVAASIGAWYGFDRLGQLRMGRLSAPAGTPVATFDLTSVLEGIERRAPKDNGTPVWSVTVSYGKNYTTQTSGLAGSAAARQGFVSQEYRTSNAADATIKTQWLMAGTLEVAGLLVAAAAGDAEAARLLALQRVRRDVWDVPLGLDDFAASGLSIMNVVALRVPRFGMAGGQLFLLIGFALNLESGTVTLTLWG